MTEIMPVPRNLILLSYQQGAFRQSLLGYAVSFWLFPQGKVTTR